MYVTVHGGLLITLCRLVQAGVALQFTAVQLLYCVPLSRTLYCCPASKVISDHSSSYGLAAAAAVPKQAAVVAAASGPAA